MPDLTRLAACSEEIVSPCICESLLVGFAFRRRVYNEDHGEGFSVRPIKRSHTLAPHSSTNDRNRPSACSHCSDTRSRYSRSSLIGLGSSSKRLSLPARTPCTIRARSSTRRCFVIACRVNLDPQAD